MFQVQVLYHQMGAGGGLCDAPLPYFMSWLLPAVVGIGVVVVGSSVVLTVVVVVGDVVVVSPAVVVSTVTCENVPETLKNL